MGRAEVDLADDSLYPHQFGCRAFDYADERHCTCSRQYFLLLTAEIRRLRGDKPESS